MKANEAPEKIYIPRLISDGKLIHEWNDVPFKKFRFFFDKEIAENIEYIRTDAFIEKAVKWFKEHKDAIAVMGFIPDYYIEDFKNYMKGE